MEDFSTFTLTRPHEPVADQTAVFVVRATSRTNESGTLPRAAAVFSATGNPAVI
jgi:hypothetical protein